ncbi:MAG: hypothetical protein DRJ50_05515 [Actinobacteria bacterium]|nr:MAG: hypothetical protein DRJ50_05515 [Actinomycetota bacterium]
MMNRIFVAVDDSSPALAAATFAIRLVLEQPAELHFVTINEPGRDSDIILRYVSSLAADAGVAASVEKCDGDHPFDALLVAAQLWKADLIIMGRSDMRRPGQPYVGSQTEHLLEFTHLPVLVVPDPEKSPQ